jgi:hypothetical protein
MPQDEALNRLFWWNPHVIPDPGPEVFAILNELPQERQAEVVAAVNEARAQIESAKSAAYQKISQIFSSGARGGPSAGAGPGAGTAGGGGAGRGARTG